MEEISLDEIVQKYQPRTYLSSFSGGKDSLVATHLAWTALLQQIRLKDCRFEIAHVNTGIALPTTLSYVRSICQDFGWKLIILKPKYNFLSMVERQGMPAPNRRWCRYYLKIEPLTRYTRFLPPPVIQITGIRAKESSKRMKMEKEGDLHQLEWRGERGCFLFSPIFWWNKKDVDQYISNNGLQVNPNYRIVNSSGECVCCIETGKQQLLSISKTYPSCMEIFAKAESLLKSGGSAFYDRKNKRRLYVSELLKQAS